VNSDAIESEFKILLVHATGSALVEGCAAAGFLSDKSCGCL
jgi:hypothetical protein